MYFDIIISFTILFKNVFSFVKKKKISLDISSTLKHISNFQIGVGLPKILILYSLWYFGYKVRVMEMDMVRYLIKKNFLIKGSKS